MGEEQFEERIAQLEQFLTFVTADKDFTLVDMTVHRNTNRTHSLNTAPNMTETSPDVTETDTAKTSPDLTETDTGETSPDLTETDTAKTSPDLTETDTGETSPDLTETDTAKTSPDLTETDTGETFPRCFAQTTTNTTETHTTIEGAQTDGTETSVTSFLNVKLHKVKPRGRPRNIQNFTRRNKRHKTDKTNLQATENLPVPSSNAIDQTDPPGSLSDCRQTLAVTEDMTGALCDERLSNHQDSTVSVDTCIVDESVCHACGFEELDRELCVNGRMDWVGCNECARWFHRHCLGSRVRVRTFVCTFCLPAVINQMNSVLQDHMHNVSVLKN
ncbi:hypothetical protein PoB_002936700 [Plakobranchus ocellatus]|uniref:PHD-type domain-containing protein n=1 Tax=Plakobranchus ocellatus TaxID=259542 RepID=A0AAV4A7N1_9GAST|nr:hypothetical protein PoB_002936700 [Plakobranchus ocellatus]